MWLGFANISQKYNIKMIFKTIQILFRNRKKCRVLTKETGDMDFLQIQVFFLLPLHIFVKFGVVNISFMEEIY